MSVTWLMASTAVVFLWVSAAGPSAQEPDGILAEARRLYWQKRFDEAIPHYARYATLRTDDTTATVEHGYCLLETGRTFDAWRVLRRAVESGRAGIEAEATWLDLSLRVKRPRDALPLAERLRKRHPENLALAQMRARVLEAAGDPGSAAQAWGEIVRTWPAQAGGSLHLGRLRSWTGDYDGAETALRRYRTTNPDDPAGNAALATVLGWRWQWDEARSILEEGLREHPGHPDLLRPLAEQRDYFAPRLEVRGRWWQDTQDYIRGSVSADVRAVLAHRVVLRAGESWSRFHQQDQGFPIVRRLSSTVGAGWIGPEDLRLEGSYTRHDSDEVGQSSAFRVEARRKLFGSVIGRVGAGRDDVTEQAFSVLGKIRESRVEVGLESSGETEVPWGVTLAGSHFSDGPERLTLRGNVKFPLMRRVGGLVRVWSFLQDDRSFFYFGPEWYSEQEFLVVFRPLGPDAPISAECRAGVEWVFGESAYEFHRWGDTGFVGEVSIEYHTPGALHLGVNLFMDRLRTDTPYSGTGVEAWLELLF